MKFLKRRTEKEFSDSAVKAYLIGLGSGTLEFIDNTIKFHISKGRVRKRTEVVREIAMADIEGMDRVGKEISITWKGITDIFVIEEAESAGAIFKKIPKVSREQKKVFEEKEVAKQELNDIVLGTILEDEEIGKEHDELLITLEELSKGAGLKININAIKKVIAKLGAEKGKESGIEKSRAVFRQQLKDIITK